MTITFRYIHVPRKDGTLRRAPFIPVYVRDKNGKVLKLVALIDSGADTTIVPKDVALVLGLKEKLHDEHTAGIGGLVSVKSSRLSFQVKGGPQLKILTSRDWV